MPKVSGRCAACNRLFTRIVSTARMSAVQYCSKPCFNQSRIGKPRRDPRRGVGTCLTCGTEFVTGQHHWPGIRRKGTKFCSNECKRIGHYRRGRICAELSPLDAAYLAGFMDGEGSFTIQRGSHGSPYPLFRVSVAGSKEMVIRWISEITGVGNVSYSNLLGEKNPNWSGKWEWHAQADAADSFTRQLLPYLKLKREHAELGIAFQERLRNPALKADRSWLEDWWQRMRYLNRRGPAPEIDRVWEEAWRQRMRDLNARGPKKED